MSCEKCEEKRLTHRSKDDKKYITSRLNIIEGQVRGIIK